MYIPKHFDEPRVDVMHRLMRAYPLATLVTLGTGGLSANHIPLGLSAGLTPFGVLQGHVARSNPVWSDFSPEVEALAVFQGPEAYISPSWYATKPQTGKVVPTWDYAVVHAYGTLRVVDDADWLRPQIESLTFSQEAGFSEPWQVSDAPSEYIQKLIGAIVGIEIVITRLSGKWKVSQNQLAEDRAGVIKGLRNLDTPGASAVAGLVPYDDTDEG